MDLVGYVKLYGEQGWCTIPVPLGRKYPDIAWKEYQTRHPTADELNGWWGSKGSYTNGNVAIITGEISGGLVIIDADKLISSKLFEIVNHYPQVKTNGGHHYYTIIKGTVPCCKFQFGDIKGDGGLVIAPPSLHPSQRLYEWVGGIDGVGAVHIESLPDGIELIKEKTTVTDVTNGARNISLTSLAGAMRAKGASPSAILSALQVTNQEISEPLPEGELLSISNSIGRYQPRDDFAKRDWV